MADQERRWKSASCPTSGMLRKISSSGRFGSGRKALRRMSRCSTSMLRLSLDETSGAIPEISANKYMLWVRFTTQGGDLKPKPLEVDVPFELTLCNF